MRPSSTSCFVAQPLGVEAIHEGLLQDHAGGLAVGDQPLCVGGIERQRLLAQHVLARVGRLHGPLGVEVVRQWVVDRVDVVGGEQVLVRAECVRDAELVGNAAGGRVVA